MTQSTLTLNATKRTATGHALDTLRKAGSMPAVVYGPKQESTNITLDQREFAKVFKAAGESTVVTIKVDGTDIPTLIHDVDHHPLTNLARHADFYAIVKGQKVKVMIPLEFVGEAPAAKAGANIVKTLHEVEVEADPMNLPHEIQVQISALTEVGGQILAGEIAMPAGVALVTGADEVVAIAAAANEEVLDAPIVGPDMSAIGDAVERGKKEEEEIPTED